MGWLINLQRRLKRTQLQRGLSTFTLWHICGFILFSIVSRASYQFIHGALETGDFSEYAFDCYCINLATQAIVPLTNWGWVIYLSIPGFILYKLGGMFHSYIFTPREGEGPKTDAEKKAREKKEKKMEKGKVKYVKH